MSSIADRPAPSLPYRDVPTPLPVKRRPFRFLASDAPPETLQRAIAANHRAWFARGALQSPDFAGRRYQGAEWLYTPEETIVPFPRLSRTSVDDALEHLIAFCRAKQTKRIACWSLLPAHPHDLGARLCARGFEWGWQPHWMVLESANMRADFAVPGELRIAIADTCEWEVGDLPYYEQRNADPLRNREAERTRRMWHFGAWMDGKIVAHSILYVTVGKLGIGGIYNVGVVPDARRRGIGGAITLAACRFAWEMGCHYVTLNSAADFLYERLGFQSLGRGQTWWMQEAVLKAPLPTPIQVAFAEAVGRGDIRALKRFNGAELPDDLNAPLPCGMTPMELAVQTRQTVSATWLQTQGATLDVLHAWDLGWKDRVSGMLNAQPELANHRTGRWQITPLHEAAMRNDIPLTQMLLAANPDLTIQDTEFHSTPLGWARHFERKEIVALIEQYMQDVAMHVGATDVGAMHVGATDVGAMHVGATSVGATE